MLLMMFPFFASLDFVCGVSDMLGWEVFLWLLHVSVTLYLTGLIWTIQRVHYPLFDRVDRLGYVEFAREHTGRITSIVMVPMLVELLSAGYFALYPPKGLSSVLMWGGLACVFVIWVVTFSLSVPAHQKLGLGYDAQAHQRLVVTNWFRTVFWTGRAVLVFWGTWLMLAEVSLR
tara:strand:- start:3578 stop:4099 length:522 start_codon:yes stop_codon:yes gene_type:complete